MRDMIFAAFFMTFLPMALRYPHIGAMIWAWLSFSSPDVYLYGFMTDIPLSKIIAVMTVLALIYTSDGRKPYVDRIMGLLLLFLVQGLLSASLAVTTLDLNWVLFEKVGKIIILCFVLNSVITTRRRLQGVIWAITMGIAFNGVDEGLKFLASGGTSHVVGVITMGDNNQFAVALLMCLPMMLYLYQTSANRLARWGLIVGMVLCAMAVIGTFSRGGFIGLVTLAIGLIALNRNKLRNGAIVLVACLILLPAAPASWFHRIDSISNADNDNSFMERVTSWKISTLIALDRPLLGGGFHAQQETTVWQHYGHGLDMFNFISSAPQQAAGLAAHSIYFEILGDLGFSGLLLFLGLLFTGLRYCTILRRRAASYPDMAWMAELGGMLRLTLIVYMVSGAALSFGYFEGIYLVLAVLSVARHMQTLELAHRVPAVSDAADDFESAAAWNEQEFGATAAMR